MRFGPLRDRVTGSGRGTETHLDEEELMIMTESEIHGPRRARLCRFENQLKRKL